jgi:hypothetical protein
MSLLGGNSIFKVLYYDLLAPYGVRSHADLTSFKVK